MINFFSAVLTKVAKSTTSLLKFVKNTPLEKFSRATDCAFRWNLKYFSRTGWEERISFFFK